MIKVVFADVRSIKTKTGEEMNLMELSIADEDTRKTATLRIFPDKDGFLPNVKGGDAIQLIGYVNYKNEISYHVNVIEIKK